MNESYCKVVPTEVDFTDAQLYRKTTTIEPGAIEISQVTQEITTNIAGHVETRNLAKPGDYIITGVSNERDVLSSAQFDKLYEPNDDKLLVYRSKNVIRALKLTSSTEMLAPWGEMMQARAGGYIVQSIVTGDIYLIEETVFAKTYAPITDYLVESTVVSAEGYGNICVTGMTAAGKKVSLRLNHDLGVALASQLLLAAWPEPLTKKGAPEGWIEDDVVISDAREFVADGYRTDSERRLVQQLLNRIDTIKNESNV